MLELLLPCDCAVAPCCDACGQSASSHRLPCFHQAAPTPTDCRLPGFSWSHRRPVRNWLCCRPSRSHHQQEALHVDPQARVRRFITLLYSIECFFSSGRDLVPSEFIASEPRWLKRVVKEVVNSIRCRNKVLCSAW